MIRRPFRALVLACALTASLPSAELAVLEPPTSAPAAARAPQRDRWSWNALHAAATPHGDLAWAPRPFAFTPGTSRRYVDFADGDDARDGATPATAWKHHPWDAAATGAARECRGIHTYVFKRGVAYRGTLNAAESGAPGDPIRLTSDPAWGSGEATICGSRHVTGWTRGAAHADIPDPAQVWWVDLDFAPRCAWEVRGETAARLALAREPNWTVTDPEDVMSGWYRWEQPQWWEGRNVTKVDGEDRHLGIDTQHLTGPAERYVGAHLWTEYGIVMGTPFATAIEAYDAERKAVAFQGTWYGASGALPAGTRYFLEDKPHYLDADGEFWFEKRGEGGRLHLRLPGDRDPNTARIEVAERVNLIDSRGMSHVEVSGLTFAFTNVLWDLTLRFFHHPDVDAAAIRLIGSGRDIRIANCRFTDVHKAVRFKAEGGTDLIDAVVVCDNDIERTDHGAIDLMNGDSFGKIHPPTGVLNRVSVLRNRLREIGGRAIRSDHSHAIWINFARAPEVAGNILHRCYGSGIFVFGGRSQSTAEEAPLSRTLIHHNRVEQALLAANDWGAIETWMCGPHYVYGNISGNPNGYWNWSGQHRKRGETRLGFAYYFDGSHKNHVFNNVAWGLTSDGTSTHCAQTAFYLAGGTVENHFFNNTAYRFFTGHQWSPRNGRCLFLGNVWIDLGSHAFRHGPVKEDAGPVEHEYPHRTMAYGRNVFHGVGEEFALIEERGRTHAGPDSMRAALEQNGALASDVGAVATSSPVRDAEKHDFRPAKGSPAIDGGAKVFVPWSLARPVGEWHFRRDNSDATIIPDSHLFLTAYAFDIAGLPRYDLTGHGVAAASFGDGPLENWTAGALSFDGKTTYASCAHELIARPFAYQYPVEWEKREERHVTGEDKASPDIHRSSLLIEAHFRTQPGHGRSVLVAKLGATAGYRLAINRAGGVTFGVRATGGDLIELASGAKVNDGKWHHVVVELDRAAGTGAIHVDGVRVAERAIVLPADASLANDADLLVGKGPDGHFFHGALDFLRICRSTLAESQTSIEELYDWQLDGPFLRDLVGRDATGKGRDAGALEAAD
ncbi:MAG TPA: LamG-like jellyroll fold domain-containing protein [Planctomycetota bacterium]|nr:LamG-like jellyroll fold domain-containing protein [Planctomycetota bacterium]